MASNIIQQIGAMVGNFLSSITTAYQRGLPPPTKEDFMEEISIIVRANVEEPEADEIIHELQEHLTNMEASQV